MFKYCCRLSVPLVLTFIVATITGIGLSATSALAYDVGPSSSESAPSVVTPGVSFPVSARFIGSNGVPDSDLEVDWSSSSFTASAPARNDGLVLMAHVSRRVLLRLCTVTFSPPTSITNAAGVATTTATITPGCFGTFTLIATIPGVGSVSATVSTIAGTAAGGFPNTSSLRIADPGTGVLIAIVATLLGLSLLGLWLRVRSRHATS